MTWVAATIILICSLIGVVLTLVTLPGMWFMLLVAIIAKVAVPDVYAWWVVIVASLLVLSAEIAEIASSAVGAKAGGATKQGITGAFVGGILGAIIGSVFFMPVIGTILGGVIGAAALATIMERNGAQRSWKESGKAGAGAAAGRVAATFIKTGLAISMGLMLTVAAFWPAARVEVVPVVPGDQSGMIQTEEP